MKTLLLLRHAKSSWDDPSLDDFDRPLAPRGQRDAPRMGKSLRATGTLPDLIVSSTARRARETVAAFAASAGLDLQPRFDERLYGASSSEMERIVRSLPASSACALLVGHNPGMEELVERLTGAAEAMPTAALACIECKVESWDGVQKKSGSLRWRLTPKTLD